MIWYKFVVWSVHDRRKMIQKDKKPVAADLFLCKKDILITDLLYGIRGSVYDIYIHLLVSLVILAQVHVRSEVVYLEIACIML